jgi:hypothetical protein
MLMLGTFAALLLRSAELPRAAARSTLRLTDRCAVLDNIIEHTFRRLIREAGVVPSQCLHRPNDLLISLQLEDGSADARMKHARISLSRSCSVKILTSVPGAPLRICRVASIPLTIGGVISRMTAFGFVVERKLHHLPGSIFGEQVK